MMGRNKAALHRTRPHTLWNCLPAPPELIVGRSPLVFGSPLHCMFGYVLSGSSCSPLARDLGSFFSSSSSVSPCSPSARDSECSFSSDSSVSTAAVTACLIVLFSLVGSSVLPCAQSACNLGSFFSSDSSKLMTAVKVLHRAHNQRYCRINDNHLSWNEERKRRTDSMNPHKVCRSARPTSRRAPKAHHMMGKTQ